MITSRKISLYILFICSFVYIFKYPIHCFQVIKRQTNIRVAKWKNIFPETRCQRGSTEFIKKLFDQLLIIFFWSLAGHQKPHRLVFDCRQGIYLIHCVFFTAGKLKKRKVAVQKDFQLSGIIVSIQRSTVKNRIRFSYLPQQQITVILLDAGKACGILLTV